MLVMQDSEGAGLSTVRTLHFRQHTIHTSSVLSQDLAVSFFVNEDMQEQLDGHLVDTLGVASTAARRCPTLRLLSVDTRGCRSNRKSYPYECIGGGVSQLTLLTASIWQKPA